MPSRLLTEEADLSGNAPGGPPLESELNANDHSFCIETMERLSCALDDALAETGVRELCAHVAVCESCRRRSIELIAADHLFREAMERAGAAVDPEKTLTPAVMAAVRHAAGRFGGVVEFTRRVAADRALQEQLRAADAIETFIAFYVAAGNGLGYRFDAKEVAELFAGRRAANEELSDELLGAVVGGVSQENALMNAFLDDVLANWFDA